MYRGYQGKKEFRAWCVAGVFALSTACFGVRDYMRHLGLIERHDQTSVNIETLVRRATTRLDDSIRDYELSKTKSETMMLESEMMILDFKKKYRANLKESDKNVKWLKEHYRESSKLLRELENLVEKEDNPDLMIKLAILDMYRKNYWRALENAEEFFNNELEKK